MKLLTHLSFWSFTVFSSFKFTKLLLVLSKTADTNPILLQHYNFLTAPNHALKLFIPVGATDKCHPGATSLGILVKVIDVTFSAWFCFKSKQTRITIRIIYSKNSCLHTYFLLSTLHVLTYSSRLCCCDAELYASTKLKFLLWQDRNFSMVASFQLSHDHVYLDRLHL